MNSKTKKTGCNPRRRATEEHYLTVAGKGVPVRIGKRTALVFVEQQRVGSHKTGWHLIDDYQLRVVTLGGERIEVRFPILGIRGSEVDYIGLGAQASAVSPFVRKALAAHSDIWKAAVDDATLKLDESGLFAASYCANLRAFIEGAKFQQSTDGHALAQKLDHMLLEQERRRTPTTSRETAVLS